MIEHVNELVYDIQPVKYERNGKLTGTADLLIIRIQYEAFSSTAFSVYKFANFNEKRIIEQGNENIEITGWENDDSILVETFAKSNEITLLGKITQTELMRRYKKIELEKQAKAEEESNGSTK